MKPSSVCSKSCFNSGGIRDCSIGVKAEILFYFGDGHGSGDGVGTGGLSAVAAAGSAVEEVVGSASILLNSLVELIVQFVLFCESVDNIGEKRWHHSESGSYRVNASHIDNIRVELSSEGSPRRVVLSSSRGVNSVDISHAGSRDSTDNRHSISVELNQTFASGRHRSTRLSSGTRRSTGGSSTRRSRTCGSSRRSSSGVCGGSGSL